MAHVDPRVHYPPTWPEGVSTQEMRERVAEYEQGDRLRRKDEAQAPSADLWAELRLEIGETCRAIRRHCGRIEKLWQSLHDVPITGPQLSTTSTPPVLIVDRPDILGPHTGFYWDVRWVVFGNDYVLVPGPPVELQITSWEGTIYLFNSLVSSATYIDKFTPTDTHEHHHYGQGQHMLAPHERLIYVAGPDFTGTATIGGKAALMTDDTVPVYLK